MLFFKKDWKQIKQPVALIKDFKLSLDAELILSQIKTPLKIFAFFGSSRSGKSLVASYLLEKLGSNFKFNSSCGVSNCTIGIDMIVIPSTGLVFLDCQGTESQSTIIYALVARLASTLIVFERGCFTTLGLESVLQLINLGSIPSTLNHSISRHLILVENMSINADIDNISLKAELLSEKDSETSINAIKRLVKQRFDVEFYNIPFFQTNLTDHQSLDKILYTITRASPRIINNIQASSQTLIQSTREILAHLKENGNLYKTIPSSQSLVEKMAIEYSRVIWDDFIIKIRKRNLHSSQITGRKHLKTILREIDSISNTCISLIDDYNKKLAPSTSVAHDKFNENLQIFKSDVEFVYKEKTSDLVEYEKFSLGLNGLVTGVVKQVKGSVGMVVRFARFSGNVLWYTNAGFGRVMGFGK